MIDHEEGTSSRSNLWLMAVAIGCFVVYALWQVIPQLIVQRVERGVAAERQLLDEQAARNIADGIQEAHEIRRRNEEIGSGPGQIAKGSSAGDWIVSELMSP